MKTEVVGVERRGMDELEIFVESELEEARSFQLVLMMFLETEIRHSPSKTFAPPIPAC